MRHHMPVCATLLAFLATSASSFTQSVLRVELDGSGDHTSVQDAIDAANSGDTLLIGTGIHGSALIDAKSLHLIPRSPTLRARIGGVQVINLDRNQQVSVERMTTLMLGSYFVGDCAGSVWFEDCEVAGSLGFFSGFVVRDSQAVVLRECHNPGVSSIFAGMITLPGVVVERSKVWIYDSVMRGGPGEVTPVLMGTSGIGGPGASGLHATESTVSIENTTLRGGAGAHGFGPFGSTGADGVGFSLNDSTVLSARGSLWDPPFVDATSTDETLPPRLLQLQLPTVVREGDLQAFQLSGLNGAPAALTFAFTLQPIELPFADGLLAAGTGYSAVPIGAPTGSLSIPTTIGNLLSTVQSAQFFVQAVQLAPTPGELLTSPPRLTTILDGAL